MAICGCFSLFLWQFQLHYNDSANELFFILSVVSSRTNAEMSVLRRTDESWALLTFGRAENGHKRCFNRINQHAELYKYWCHRISGTLLLWQCHELAPECFSIFPAAFEATYSSRNWTIIMYSHSHHNKIWFNTAWNDARRIYAHFNSPPIFSNHLSPPPLLRVELHSLSLSLSLSQAIVFDSLSLFHSKWRFDLLCVSFRMNSSS